MKLPTSLELGLGRLILRFGIDLPDENVFEFSFFEVVYHECVHCISLNLGLIGLHFRIFWLKKDYFDHLHNHRPQ